MKLDTLRLSRRDFLAGAAALSSTILLSGRRAWSDAGKYPLPEATLKATAESPLIYVSPLRSDGGESKCHAEIWFVPAGEDLLVCTPVDAWRTRAIKKGLDQARIWVGDFGTWTSSGEKYRSAANFVAKASVVPAEDEAVAKCLADMGKKYESTGWSTYGPRFHKGMKDGSRVVIRYRPTGA